MVFWSFLCLWLSLINEEDFLVCMVVSALVQCMHCQNLCISCTFLLKYWAQNRGCGLYSRLLISSMGLLNSQLGKSFSRIDTVLVSRPSFVNNHMVTMKKKFNFSCDWAWFLHKLQLFHFDCGLQQWRQLLSVARIREIY